MAPNDEEGRLVAVMFADVVGYSRLMAADEETGVRARRRHREIARELDVEGVIEGSVQREADRIRVTLRLIDGFTDRLRWSESYERHVHGVLALQSEIARSVAREIRLQLTPHEEEALAGPLGRWFARVRRLEIPED